MGDAVQNVADTAGDLVEDSSVRDGPNDLAAYLPFDIDPTAVPPFLKVDVSADVPLPADGYRPRLFEGPRRRAERFHNIPRGGNTNDIVSLTRWKRSGYDHDTARDYVMGIVVISVVMALIYVIWAVLLLILRAGRLGECRCCCFRGCRWGMRCVEAVRARGGCLARNLCGWMSGRVPRKPTKESLIRDEKLKESGMIHSSVTAASSLVSSAKSTVAKAVVSSSREKSEEEAATFMNEEGGEYTGDIDTEDIEGDSDAKVTSVSDASNVEEAPGADDGNDPGDGNTQADATGLNGAPGADGANETADVNVANISEEYLAKRRRREERSMIAIRCCFLFSGLVVLASCISLCIVGFRAIDDLTSTARGALVSFEDYFGSVVDECDTYINRTAAVRETRETFFARIEENWPTNDTSVTSGVISGVGANQKGEGLCPNAPTNGIITLNVNLGNLFDGPLLKLAETRDAVTGEDKIAVISFLNGTKLGAALDFDFQGLRELVETLVNTRKESIRDLISGNVSDVGKDADSVGGDAASFTIITSATSYTNRDLSALLATNFSFSINMVEIADRINAALEAHPAFISDSILNLRNGAQMLLEDVQSLDETMDDVRPYWYIAVVFAALLMVLVVLMMVGCLLAWTRKQPQIFRNINGRFFLPVFILIGMLVWVFTCVFLCLAILSSDLCVNNPDIQVDGMLANTLKPRSPIGYNFATYYLHGCQPEERPLLMELLLVALVETRKAAAEFFNILSNLGPGPLGRACGNDFNLWRAGGYLLSTRIDASLNVVLSLANILLCNSFHPLYSSLMYNALCTDIINLLGPMFTSLCIMALFSMVMVTLRVALYELVDDLGDEQEKEEDTGCCISCRMKA